MGTLGGKRPGAGRKKGQVAKSTLDALEAKKIIIKRVNDATNILIDSQLSIARGLSFLYRIGKDDNSKKEKPFLVTSSIEIEAYLRGDFDSDPEKYYYITAEKPNNQAIDSLFDRVHGKPTQSVSGVDGGPIQINVIKYD